MNSVLETLCALCAALAAAELLRRFCPDNQAVRFVAGVAALGLLLSALGGLLGGFPELSVSLGGAQRQEEEFTSYLEGAYEQAAQEDAQAYLRQVLAAAGLEAKEIRVKADRNEEGSIVFTEVAATFDYPSQAQRAQALLQAALGEEVDLAVEAGGERRSRG